nr:GrpB family protein [Metabacillus flavus]
MSLEETRHYKEAFTGIGYEMVDHEEFPYRVFFRKGSFGAGTCHLHICEYQNDYWNNLITFRNILRKDRKIRTEYESLKISLAGKYQDDRQKYTEGKSDFILRALAQA